MDLWFIGVALSVLASLCGTLGLALQKKTHLQIQEARDRAASRASEMAPSKLDAISEESEAKPQPSDKLRAVKEEENGRSEEAEENGDEDSADEETGAISRTGTESQAAEQEANKYYKHPLWLLGMFLVICNAFLDVAAFGFAPQSMLSPMGALTLVFNTVLAPKLLGETLSRRDIFGTAVIVAGTVITVSFAPRATPEYTVSIIRDLYMRFVVLVYGCVVVGLITLSSLVCYLFDAEGGGRTPTGLWTKLFPLCFPLRAALVGGCSVLFSKSSVELLLASIRTENQFVKPEPYVFIFLLAISLFHQVKFLNEGLARFDALFMIPMYQVIWMIAGIVGGGIFFREFERLKGLQFVFFPVGLFVSICGIYILTQRNNLKQFDTPIAPEEPLPSVVPQPQPLKRVGLSEDGTRTLLALGAHRTSVIFGMQNSPLVAISATVKPNHAQFADPAILAHRRKFKQRHANLRYLGNPLAPSLSAPRRQSYAAPKRAAPPQPPADRRHTTFS